MQSIGVAQPLLEWQARRYRRPTVPGVLGFLESGGPGLLSVDTSGIYTTGLAVRSTLFLSRYRCLCGTDVGREWGSHVLAHGRTNCVGRLTAWSLSLAKCTPFVSFGHRLGCNSTPQRRRASHWSRLSSAPPRERPNTESCLVLRVLLTASTGEHRALTAARYTARCMGHEWGCLSRPPCIFQWGQPVHLATRVAGRCRPYRCHAFATQAEASH